MKDNKISIRDEQGEILELYILEETKFNNAYYILVTDAKEDEDGECYVLKDCSEAREEEARYEFVEDDLEAEQVFDIFTELMQDTDTGFIK